MTLIAEPLIQYLHQLEAHGHTHVNVDDEARAMLREFYKRAQGGGATGEVRSSAPVAAPSPSKVPQPVMADSNQSAGPSAPVESPSGISVVGATAREKMDSLRAQAQNWQPARSLGSFRDTMVFSTGNLEADIMLIGEAPGFDEERLGEPFAGRAGQKLDAILKAMGTERKQTYISNIVKFRPKMANQTTSNRKPTPQELKAWLPFIEEEVKVVAPKVLVALGGTAAQALLACELSVARMRGEFHRFQGVPLRVTYHPSYILHEGVTPEKRMLWEDMLSIMELLNMPISEKQRGYFSK